MERSIWRSRWPVVAFAAAAMLAVSTWAGATVTHFVTSFTTLNSSGVTGNAWLTLDGDSLTVHIIATGLEPDQAHPQHIHGTFDASGNPTQATTPTMAQDANADGVLEVLEGAATYGPILVPLTLDGLATGAFSTAPGGTIDYTQTFDLTNSGIYFGGASEPDLFPLSFREIVIHGLTAPVDITNGGLDGMTFFAAGTYDPFIPVASGVLRLASVPEPADLGMLGGGLGLLLGLLWLRRRTDRRRMDA